MWNNSFALLLIIIFSFVASDDDDDCDKLYSKYFGYPNCRGQLLESLSGGTWDCAAQKNLSSESAGSLCPDPDWVDISGAQVLKSRTYNADGSITLQVYRAVQLYDDNGPVPMSNIMLLNANAGSLGGIMSSLVAELLPNDMRSNTEEEQCKRKNSIDAIMVYNVTVKSPLSILQQFMGPFGAMFEDECIASKEVGGPCNFHSMGGYASGYQAVEDHVQSMFSGYLYSFPKCGFCDWPTGEWNCTYTYDIVGHIMLDELVFPYSSNAGDYTDFHTYCKGGGVEFNRTASTRPGLQNGDCTIEGGIYETDVTDINFNGLDFWSHVCDKRLADYKVQLLSKMPVHTDFAQHGVFPDKVNNCPSSLENLTLAPTAAPIDGFSQIIMTSCSSDLLDSGTTYQSKEAAIAACLQNPEECHGFYDSSCDGPPFVLCKEPNTWGQSSRSCVYQIPLPTSSPSLMPTAYPSSMPTASPSSMPTVSPSSMPTASPSSMPTASPSLMPTTSPSLMPSTSPSSMPSTSPSFMPTTSPSSMPTASPSSMPITSSPSLMPTTPPSSMPTASPSLMPTASPITMPTASPIASPTTTPTTSPNISPTASVTAVDSRPPTIPPTPQDILNSKLLWTSSGSQQTLERKISGCKSFQLPLFNLIAVTAGTIYAIVRFF